jgi:hypothetical protein
MGTGWPGLAMQIRFDVTRWLPGWRTLRQYQVGWLPNDIVAGLVLSTMLVPVGMAYAVASGFWPMPSLARAASWSSDPTRRSLPLYSVSFYHCLLATRSAR